MENKQTGEPVEDNDYYRLKEKGYFGINPPNIIEQLLSVIETKNSWGKNELKEEILRILARYHK